MQNIEINFEVRPCIVTQNGEEKIFDTPQCIGMCSIES